MERQHTSGNFFR